MSLPSQRRRQILEEIRRAGAGSVSNLSNRFEVSETTIRRDLRILEEEGQIERTHGGAVSQASKSDAPPIIARDKRRNLHAAQKSKIAHYIARELVRDGDNIALEGGTTISALAPLLADKSDLTVVTNGLAVTNELHAAFRHHNDATILCCGGILRGVSSTFVGPVAEQFFRSFHVNKLFLSATGLTLDSGVSDPSMLETQVKRAMIAAAGSVIVAMDSSKFGIKSLLTVLHIDEIDVLVTDDGISEPVLHALLERGVDVRLAS